MKTNTVTPAAPARPILKPEGLSSCVSGETPTTSPSSSTSSRRRIVNFDRVTIREFAYDIGDHPWTSEGLPISISWDHQDETTVQLDLYETRKCSPPGFPPNVLSTQQRRDILIRAGYSPLDLQEAQGELDRVWEGRCRPAPPRHRPTLCWRFRSIADDDAAGATAGTVPSSNGIALAHRGLLKNRLLHGRPPPPLGPTGIRNGDTRLPSLLYYVYTQHDRNCLMEPVTVRHSKF